MRRSTALMSQWKAQRATGKNIFDSTRLKDAGAATQSFEGEEVIVTWKATGGTDTYRGIQFYLPITWGELVGKYISVSALCKVSGGNEAMLRFVGSYATTESLPGGMPRTTSTEFVKLHDVIRIKASPDGGEEQQTQLMLYASYTSKNLPEGVYTATYKEIQVEINDEVTEYEPFCGGSSAELTFRNCKGGYFSEREEYGLGVMGSIWQEGTPTVDAPVPIQCVRAGTRIFCGNDIFTPCDLYEGDVWYPMSGKVERRSNYVEFDKIDGWATHNTGSKWIFLWAEGDSKNNTIVTSSHYLFHSTSELSLDGRKIRLDSTGQYLCINDHRSMEEWKAWLLEQRESGCPVGAVYRRRNSVIEQYEPQKLWSHGGTVTVSQEPAELPAKLSATMLVRR